MEFRYNELNGMRVAYTSETVFHIQIGKRGRSYRTVASIVGNLAQTVAWYNGYNVRAPWQKRIWVPSFNKPLLARCKGV